MAVQKKYQALGRGLDALIATGEVKTSGSSSIGEISVRLIVPNPNQPRRDFSYKSLDELADSIKELVIVQPITLRNMGDGSYQIIAGERRWRAAQRAGLKTVPAYIRTADDEKTMQMALVENIQREDLNPIEIALAYQGLIEQYGLKQEGFGLKVVKIGENGVTEKDILVHDAHSMDNTLQLKQALMEGPDFPVALGVIRDVEAPTYDDAVNAQIEEVAAKKKYHNFQELLMTNDIWEVK